MEQLVAAINSLLESAGSVTLLSKASSGAAIPNPVKGLTAISYHLPLGSRTAHIVVTDIKSNIISQINLSGNGSGQVKLNTAALAAGTYTYSLFVDGSKIASKQIFVAR